MCELLLTIREPTLNIVKIEYQLVEHYAQVIGESDPSLSGEDQL